MLYVLQNCRKLAAGAFLLWAAISVVSLFLGWSLLFGAMGSLLLSLGVAVFLTERYRANERRRLWDHDLQGQLRLLAEVANRAHGNAGSGSSRPLHEIQGDLEESFEQMTLAKAEEEGDETWREEMIFTIVGTLQWGFGSILADLIHR